MMKKVEAAGETGTGVRFLFYFIFNVIFILNVISFIFFLNSTFEKVKKIYSEKTLRCPVVI